MPLDDILLETEEKMESALEYLHKEFRGIRTGRASAGLVDHIKVDYYGSPTDLRQLASIATPEPNLIVIKPFDPGSIKSIEKAIQASDLGITPQTDKNIVRLNVPALSIERRKQLVNQVKKMTEAARVAVRNARRDGNKQLEKEQKSSQITEDDAHTGKEKTQDLTKQYEQKIDELLDTKVKDIEQS